MSWLKWIWAYLFDCVHAHITWPHRDRRGEAYVACLDCGRDLPYSLESMQIVTKEEQLRDRKRTRLGAGSPAAACLALLAALVFLNSTDAIAQRVEGADTKIAGATVEHAPATLVVGFVGGYVHSDDRRHSEVQLARKLKERYGDRVTVEVFENHRRDQARKAILKWAAAKIDRAAPATQPNIILFGHSWGASALVYLARELQREGVPVALTIQVDSVRKHHQDDSVIPANVAEAMNFYQSKGVIHGTSMIVAANPSRTTILGNLRFEYDKEPAECRAYPWYDRVFFKGHTSIECDPQVWSQIEQLIEARVTATPAQAEVAAQLGN